MNIYRHLVYEMFLSGPAFGLLWARQNLSAPLSPQLKLVEVCVNLRLNIFIFSGELAAVGLCPRLEPTLVFMTRFNLFILNCVVHVISNILTNNTDPCKDVANGYNYIIYSIKSRFQKKTKPNLYDLKMTTKFSYWSLTFCV